LEELLAHNRKTKIVWQHVGWDNLGNMTPTLVKRLLGDHANLYVSMRVEDRPKQIESSEDMPNRIVGKDGKITTAWLDVINQYSDRVLIGSDEFVAPAGNDVKFPTSFVSTWSILSQLSAEVAKKVGHDNAASVYNLK
jgi:predicted TIM-barrel fold metal-dependent hydrolase